MVLALGVCVAAVGCEDPNKKDDMQDPAASTDTSAGMQPDMYGSDPASAMADAGSYGSPPLDSSAGMMPAGSNSVHVVAKGDTLYGLARKYYNDQRRWKDIYEANRGTLANPDTLKVGQELVIP